MQNINWITAVMFALVLAFSQSVAAEKNKDHQSNGQPFQELQSQIDELSLRLDAVESTPSVLPGQSCPSGQFVTGIAISGDLICTDMGDGGGGGPLDAPVLISATGPLSVEGAIDEIWESVSTLLDDFLSDEQCAEAGFVDCRDWFDTLMDNFGVTSLARYEIDANANVGASLVFYLGADCTDSLHDAIVQYLKAYVEEFPLNPDLLQLLGGLSAPTVIDLWSSLGIFQTMATLPAAGSDGISAGDIFVPQDRNPVYANAVSGSQVSACSDPLFL